MAFFSFLQHIAQGDKKPGGGVFGALNNVANPKSPPPRPVQQSNLPGGRPNFTFLGTGKPGTSGHTNWGVVPQFSHPVATPSAQLPKNVPNSIGVYGDNKGNRWYENDATGQRLAPSKSVDAPSDTKIKTNKPIITAPQIKKPGSNQPTPTEASIFNSKNADTAVKVGKGIFHFLATANKAEVKAAGNLVKGAVQYTARTPETAVRSGAQVTYDVLNKVTGNQAPKTDFSGGAPAGLKKSVYGDPAQTYQSRIKGNQEKGGIIGKAAVPLGVAGALLDIAPLGGARKSIGEQLSKAATSSEVKKILGKDTPDHIAQAIAQTKDSHVIQNILEGGGSKIQPPPPIVPKPNPSQIAEQANKQSMNKHLQTIGNAQTTGPELQQAIKGLKQTHDVRDTQKLADQAKQAVEKDYTGSMSKVLNSENPSDKDIAIGEHLIVKAQEGGRIDEAVNIAETLDRTLREHGRAVQAGSLIGRLSPEGQLLAASRQIRRAREANPKNIARETNTAKEIQDTLEGTQLDKKAVSGAVKDTIEGAKNGAKSVKADLSTGEQVAKKVEAAASPAVKKQADTLVNEITKKVKQEMLEPKVSNRKSPIDVIKEVMSRNPEAQEAFPEAQRILKEKFANHEQMSEALDKFFKSKLGTPVAETTFNRAIAEQLKKNEKKVTEIIHSSWNSQNQSMGEVIHGLTKEGFDPESAKTIATEVSNRLTKQLADAKKATLERMGQDVKAKNQPTFLEKVNKFSNLGALDKEDYLHLARAKLNLPHLSTETAGKISELSQKLQELPEGHDKYATIRQIQHLIADEIPQTKGQIAKEVIGLPRTIMASGDLSFGGRQGLVYATSHPIKFAKAWPQQFEYFKQAFKGSDSEAYDAMMADVRSNPMYTDLEKHGRLIEPTGHDTRTRSEQFLSSDLANKIPLVGRLVRGSNYAFAGLHNTLYANQFYGMVEHLKYAGIKPSEDQLDKIAEAIGTSLGRGGKKGGFAETHGGFLSTALFAPRLIASRLNVMNPAYYIRQDGPARQEALRGLLGLSAFAGSVLGLAKLAGADVGTDPRSADFGKIKDGDTRFDLLGGFTQYIRLGTRLTTGQSINSTTGAESEAGKGIAGSRLDIASNFIQGKENPSLSFVTDLLKGKDVAGNSIYNPKGIGKEVASRFIPLLAQDMADLQTHKNSAGLGAGVAGLFGAGIQTYGVQDEPVTTKQQAKLDDLKATGVSKPQQEATKSFFQFLKVGAGKNQNTSDDINKALAKGNIDKAQSLADQYNKHLVEALKPWAKKNLNYLNDDLAKEFESNLINLTDQSVNSRLKTILSNPKKYGIKPGSVKVDVNSL